MHGCHGNQKQLQSTKQKTNFVSSNTFTQNISRAKFVVVATVISYILTSNSANFDIPVQNEYTNCVKFVVLFIPKSTNGRHFEYLKTMKAS